MPREQRNFDAMGVTVEVGGGDADAFARIKELFGLREAVFSRFRADSELVRLNRDPGVASEVSPTFGRAVAAAISAARATGGLVDPTLGAALEAAGYDSDFAELARSAPARPGGSGLLAPIAAACRDPLPGSWNPSRSQRRRQEHGRRRRARATPG